MKTNLTAGKVLILQMEQYQGIDKMIAEYGNIKLSDLSAECIEKGKEYIDNLDLSQITLDGKCKSVRFDEITNSLDLVKYLTSKNKIQSLSEQYVSHYTSLWAAERILESGKFQLNNPQNMNDGLEFSGASMDTSKLYFASFSLENGENIGMWSMYGQPWEQGIKLSIPKKRFIEWAGQISEVFNVDPKTRETILVNPISKGNYKASISRVAYVQWGENSEVKMISCGERSKNEIIKHVDTKLLSGLIKDAAWAYEKEIRLRVDLIQKTGVEKVAVNIPKEILNEIVVTTGPRFENGILSRSIIRKHKMEKSIYDKKLNWVYCDSCKNYKAKQ